MASIFLADLPDRAFASRTLGWHLHRAAAAPLFLPKPQHQCFLHDVPSLFNGSATFLVFAVVA